jgi:hypothetical protein
MSTQKSLALAALVTLSLAVTGCVTAPFAAPASSRSITSTAAPLVPSTAIPTNLPANLSPAFSGGLATTLSGQCNLLNSQDLGHFYASAEIIRATPQVSPTVHPVFSTTSIATTEVACTFYVFHRPGSKVERMLQVNYWVDVPASANANAQAQIWLQAKSLGAQTIPGIGDDAFYANGRLTFEKSPAYVTIEALTNDTSTGPAQQLDIEKQIAVDMLKRLS